MKRPDPRGDRVLFRGRDGDLLVVLDAGGRAIARPAQAIAAADGLVGPPGPVLVVEQGVMQHDDPSAAFDEISQVLLAGFVQVAGEIVHDDDVVLAAQVGLEGGRRS